MAVRCWLMLLACGLPLMLTMASPHRVCTENQIDKPNLVAIMARLSHPFVELKNQRNAHLDEISRRVLSYVDETGEDLRDLFQVLQKLFTDHKEIMPRVQKSLSALLETAGAIASITPRCALPSHDGPDAEETLQSLRQQITSHFSNASRFGETVQNIADVLAQRIGNAALSHLHHRAELEATMTCDKACQEQVLSGNLGKIAAVEDLAEVMTTLLGAQIEQHRDRYMALLAMGQKLETDVLRAQVAVKFYVRLLRKFTSTTSDMQIMSTSALDAFGQLGIQLHHDLKILCP